MAKPKPPIDVLLDQIEWTELCIDPAPNGDLPIATHEGWLDIGVIKVHVFQLNNGRRVIDQESIWKLFGARLDENE